MKKRTIVILMMLLCMIIGVTAAVFGDTAAPGSENDPVVTKSYVDSSTTYTVIQLSPGQRLIGGASTEIIVRSGGATAIGIVENYVENGIADLTGGADLMTGKQVVNNHLLLVPRADGRGIAAVTECWVMVKGTYSVE